MADSTQDQQKLWEAGKYYASALGSVPNSFSSTIRTLLADHQTKPNNYSDSGRFMAQRLAKSQSLQAKLQHAALTYFPEDTPQEGIPYTEFLDMFGSFNLAIILGTVYTYGKCRKRCDAHEFEIISKLIQDATEVGGHLGVAIPKIGLGNGILCGAFSIMSCCPFMLQDMKGYKEYKRATKPKGLRYSLANEEAQFTCNHAHVSSWILPSLGFGIQIARSLTEGMMAESGTAPLVDQDSYKHYVCLLWIESLLKTGNPPEITHKGGYYPMQADMDKLLKAVAEIRKSGSKYQWLEKGREEQAVDADATTNTATEE